MPSLGDRRAAGLALLAAMVAILAMTAGVQLAFVAGLSIAGLLGIAAIFSLFEAPIRDFYYRRPRTCQEWTLSSYVERYLAGLPRPYQVAFQLVRSKPLPAGRLTLRLNKPAAEQSFTMKQGVTGQKETWESIECGSSSSVEGEIELQCPELTQGKAIVIHGTLRAKERLKLLRVGFTVSSGRE